VPALLALQKSMVPVSRPVDAVKFKWCRRVDERRPMLHADHESTSVAGPEKMFELDVYLVQGRQKPAFEIKVLKEAVVQGLEGSLITLQWDVHNIDARKAIGAQAHNAKPTHAPRLEQKVQLCK